MKFPYYVLGLLFLVTSCSSNSDIKSFSSSNTDVSSFSKLVVKNLSTAMDKMMSSLLTKTEKKEGYTVTKAEFFPEGGVTSVRKSFSDYCQQLTGKLTPKGVCKNNINTYFYFKSWLTGTRGSNLDEVAFIAVAPSNNRANNNFLKKIIDIGYTGSLKNVGGSSLAVDNAGKCEVFIYYDLSKPSDVKLINNGKKIAELNSKTYVNYFVEPNSENHYLIKENMLFGVTGDTLGKIDFQCKNKKPLFIAVGLKSNYSNYVSVVPFGRGKTLSGIRVTGSLTIFQLKKIRVDIIRKNRNIKMPLL